MKQLYIVVCLFVMIALRIDATAQNTISIQASDLTVLLGSSNDTAIAINNVTIQISDRLWTSLDSNDFYFGGSLLFDLRAISSIDSINLDYFHTCTGCYTITFYDANGDSIVYDNPPQDSTYTYNASVPLSFLKIWGLESGFRTLDIYSQTLNTTDLALESGLAIYPNPFSQQITIDNDFVSIEKQSHKMRVYDLYGKVVYDTYLAVNTLKQYDLSFLADGMYVMTIATPDELYSTKMIKQ